MPEVYRDDISDPAQMVRMADEQLTDEQFAKEGFIVSSAPRFHPPVGGHPGDDN
jgi:hypothetical protein